MSRRPTGPPKALKGAFAIMSHYRQMRRPPTDTENATGTTWRDPRWALSTDAAEGGSRNSLRVHLTPIPSRGGLWAANPVETSTIPGPTGNRRAPSPLFPSWACVLVAHHGPSRITALRTVIPADLLIQALGNNPYAVVSSKLIDLINSINSNNKPSRINTRQRPPIP